MTLPLALYWAAYPTMLFPWWVYPGWIVGYGVVILLIIKGSRGSGPDGHA